MFCIVLLQVIVAPAQAVSIHVCAVLDQAAPGGAMPVAPADVQKDLLGNPPISEQISTGKVLCLRTPLLQLCKTCCFSSA